MYMVNVYNSERKQELDSIVLFVTYVYIAGIIALLILCYIHSDK